MKKKMICMVLGMIVAGAMVGCGSSGKADGNEGSQQASSDAADGAGGGDNTAVIWTNLENEAKVLSEYAQKWETETGKKVEVIHETARYPAVCAGGKKCGWAGWNLWGGKRSAG